MISRKWYLVAPMVSLIMGGTMAASRETKPACVLAKEWVADHADELPQTYTQYAKYSGLYREAIYPHLTKSVRESMWRWHLEEYLSAESGLTDVQREFIRGVIARLPVYIDSRASSGAFQGEQTARKARELFGAALSARMFSQLVSDSRLNPALVTVVSADTCKCARGDNCGTATCVFKGCSGGTDCGSGGGDACTGMCGAAEEPVFTESVIPAAVLAARRTDR